MENVDKLIDYLLNENPKIKVNRDFRTSQDKFNLYRSLCNIRQPNDISEEFLKQEEFYLKEIRSKKNIMDVTSIDTIENKFHDTRINNSDKMALWQGDITTLSIDAIVNAANSQGLGCFIPGHNCIDNQINTYAGVALRLECNEYMKTIGYNLPTGGAFITNAYNLPAEYVIHTVGPIVESSVTNEHKNLLRKCYISCLDVAKENNVRTIAFCSISTGVFRFPKDLASQIALRTVDNYLEDNYDYFDKIVFNVYGNEDVEVYEKSIRENQ